MASFTVEFQFERSGSKILLTAFRPQHERWYDIPYTARELQHHSHLLNVQTEAISSLLDEDFEQTVIELKVCTDTITFYRKLVSQGTGQRGSRDPSDINSLIQSLFLIQQNQQQQTNSLMGKLLEVTNNSIAAKIAVPKFDGKRQSAKSWMTFFEKACKLNRWLTDEQKISYLLAYLEPGSMAEKWYNSLFASDGSENRDWSSWKESFLSAFGQNPLELASHANKWQYRGGNLLEYFYEKQRLLDLAYGDLSDRAFNILVMLGLSPEIQSQLALLDINSREQLRKALERIKPTKYSQGEAREQNDSKLKNSKTKFINEVNRGLSPYVCSFSSLTHKITINNVTLEALLDTGASVNLIRSQIVKKNEWECQKESNVLRGFNGSSQRVGKSVQIAVSENNVEILDKAYVLSNLAYDLILGLPTLTKLGYKIMLPAELPFNSISHDLISNKADILKYFPNLTKQEKIPNFFIEFQLKPDAPIVKQKPYRLSRAKYEWAQFKIQELLQRNIIRPSSSDYASPCVIVPKENGDWRLCQDYREINKFTELDPFPFPIIDDIICNFGGCTYFSKFDLKDGFLQLQLTESTKKYTAFVLPFGHYEFQRLPFGWKNSPSKFQRAMTYVLGDLLEDPHVRVYIDDIIIGGTSQEECARKTFLALQKLNEAHLSINIDKSWVCVKSVSFLGRVIDGKTKTTKEESVEKVKKMVRPHDLHTLRVFTGLTGHFRAFIPNYAQIVRPLDRLKAKDTKFIWSEEAERSFQSLVAKITSNRILQLPDWSLKFELCTDASQFGCGAILYQRDFKKKKNQQLRVIGYYSHTFTAAEENYSVTDKEALAVANAIKYFRTFLEGREFIVHTDHQALTHIMTQKEPKGRLARWQVFLMGYNLKINHRKGKELQDADAISRLCIQQQEIYSVKKNDFGKISVDPQNIPAILRLYHDEPGSGGHDGFLRTYLKLKQRFAWPRMKQDVLKHVKSCHTCQMVKFKFKPRYDSMVIPVLSTNPFETLHVDFAEQSKKSESQKTTKSFLVVVDEFSKMTFAKAIKESSRAIINYLKKFPYLEKVKKIVSNNGAQFTSSAMRKFAEEHGIKLVTTSPYHPAGNGIAERKIRDLKQFLACYPNFKGGWKSCLEAAVRHLNRSYSTSIGCSSHFKALGTISLYPADSSFGISKDMIKEIALDEEAQGKYRSRMKKQFDRRHAHGPPKIKEGSLVLVQHGVTGKHPNIKGPFAVKKIVFMSGYPKNIVYIENGEEIIAAIKNVVPYHCRNKVENQVGDEKNRRDQQIISLSLQEQCKKLSREKCNTPIYSHNYYTRVFKRK